MAKKNTNRTKAAELAKAWDGGSTLGEIVSWSSTGANGVSVGKVRESLDAAGLDQDLAKDLSFRSAFVRACRELSKGKDRLFDICRVGNDWIIFQLSRRMAKESGIEYERDVFLRMHKASGKIQCKNPKVRTAAEQALKEAMVRRGTSDISRLVQRIFDTAEADLFPLREQGGVYFVPREYVELVDRVEKFLTGIGGNVLRIPVPKGTEKGDAAVRDTVADGVRKLVEEYREAVGELDKTSTEKSIEAVAERIKLANLKVEAYAAYLGDRQKELAKEAAKLKKELAAKLEAIKKDRVEGEAVEQTETGKRVRLFGYTLTEALRIMAGKLGWDAKRMKAFCEALEIEVANSTVAAQVSRARGKRHVPDCPKEVLNRIEQMANDMGV